MEDEFLLGRNLLVKPVTTQGQNSIDVYLPGKDEVGSCYLRVRIPVNCK